MLKQSNLFVLILGLPVLSVLSNELQIEPYSGAISALPLSGSVAAVESSPYAGQAAREIKSLSAEDIAELRRGGGWGLAKAAELNGVPGPVHLLQLQEEIPLEDNQVARIQAIYSAMQREAIDSGTRLVELERDLDAGFRNRSIGEGSLRGLLKRIGDVRTELRYIHLLRHLQMLDILSDDQIQSYNALRGYAGDACSRVPKGHDADSWRKHNDCE